MTEEIETQTPAVSPLKQETDLMELVLSADSELLSVNEQLMASYEELI